MRLVGDGFVRVFHWIAPVILPLLVLYGRAIFGAPLGWLAAFGILLVPFVLLPMYLAPILVVFDRDARQTRRTRSMYNLASYILWAAFLVMMLTLVDGGDTGESGSVLSTWGVGDTGVSTTLFTIAAGVAGLAFLGQIISAIVGISEARRMPPRV